MRTQYVAGFAFHEDEVLLIEKQRPAWQKGLWNGVGGHVEPGETHDEAMSREFREETGMTILPGGWQLVAVLKGRDFEVAFYRTRIDNPYSVSPLTDEKIRWFSIYDLPPTIPNLNWLVPMAYHEIVGRGMPYTITEYGVVSS